MSSLEKWVFNFLRDNYVGDGDFETVYDAMQEAKDVISEVKDGTTINEFVRYMSVDFNNAKDLYEVIKEWEVI